MISTLTISGFRGISDEIPFKLGAITLLAGRNGLGKTTVFDAIDWCLFGASWRLGFDAEAIRNIYHPTLDPVVRMEIRLPDKTLLIERTGESAFLNGSRISDRDLAETLMTDPGAIEPYARDVERRLRRLVYLSQEDIRALVHPDSASERVSLFQALLGVPNASAMQSGVRRISEHFRQREQDIRLHLGQLRSRKDELRTTLQEANTETIETPRIISEACRTLNLPPSFSIDNLARKSRSELDALSVASIQLDEAVSEIAAYRERRKAAAAEAERLSQEIQICSAEEAAAAAANDEGFRKLTLARRASEERSRALTTSLEFQRRLQEHISAQQRIDELSIALEEANGALRSLKDSTEGIRKDLERARISSDLALDRRRTSAVRRSELNAARDRARTLLDRQREETTLVARANSLADGIRRRVSERDLLRMRLQESREEMSRRRDEHDRLSKTASSSDALEALLRQVVTMLPADQNECPLCGSSFESHQELLRHVSETRAQYTLTSEAFSVALKASRTQEEVVGEFERQLKDADREVVAMEKERNQCDESLRRVRAIITTIPTHVSAPTDEQLQLADEELQSIDEELKVLKNDIDDKTIRLGVTQDDVLRTTARLQAVTQQLLALRQSLDPTLPLTGLKEQVAGAESAVNSASKAAREAGDAEKAAAEDQLAKQNKLHSVSRHLNDLRSKILSLREREAAETITLLGQLADQFPGVASVEEAAEQIGRRRVDVTQRLVVMKRLWSELVAAGSKERSEAIHAQIDAVEKEMALNQSSLNQLLHANNRFTMIASELQKTAESEAADALRHQRQAIQECFAAMYPHWHLNEVVVGDDPLGEILVTDNRLAHGVAPTTYLSTGQANVLGLSIFMGIALRQRLLRIGVVCLDEPVQHLDDLHFLGFVSLIKRVGLSRQVVLSTADANVAEIITRQMQSSWAEMPTDFIRYDWHSFDPETGPSVVMRETTKQAVA